MPPRCTPLIEALLGLLLVVPFAAESPAQTFHEATARANEPVRLGFEEWTADSTVPVRPVSQAFDGEAPDDSAEGSLEGVQPLVRQTSLGGHAGPRPGRHAPPEASCDECYTWQGLPDGLMYKSYLAGEKEPRFTSVWVGGNDGRYLWDIALGGRLGVLRYGTDDRIDPDGFQLDMEGAALPRLDLEESQDLEAADFRFGIPLTWRRGPLAFKTGYYHISSHVGDEFLERNPGFQRINYVRESLLFGVRYDWTPDFTTYGELGYAFATGGGAEPLEFQFGFEYLPRNLTKRGAPFAGVNAHLREEFDFGGGLNVEAGWQWHGDQTDHVWRVGVRYYTGKSIQYSFLRRNDDLVGLGLWYDY